MPFFVVQTRPQSPRAANNVQQLVEMAITIIKHEHELLSEGLWERGSESGSGKGKKGRLRRGAISAETVCGWQLELHLPGHPENSLLRVSLVRLVR